MTQAVGCFQFFYSSREPGLPYPDVPTRDVTNTARAGYKTEPLLEQRLENWCECRENFVTPRVNEALNITKSGGRHYMILTTVCPKTGHEVAVGVLAFSQPAYDSLVRRFPGRWNSTHQPYTGGRSSKIVRFADAYHLRIWMETQSPPKKYMPGKRYGIVKAPAPLLNKILGHFATVPDNRTEFLANVRHLERQLKRNGPEWAWQDYQARMRGVAKAKCSRRKTRTC